MERGLGYHPSGHKGEGTMRDHEAHRRLDATQEAARHQARATAKLADQLKDLRAVHALCDICGGVVHVGLDGERLLATHPMERNRVIHSRCRPDTKDDRRKVAP